MQTKLSIVIKKYFESSGAIEDCCFAYTILFRNYEA